MWWRTAAGAVYLFAALGCASRPLRVGGAVNGGTDGGAISIGAGGSIGGGSAATSGFATGGAGGAPTEGACGGPLPTPAEGAQYCVGIDQLSLADARIVDLDGDNVISPGETFDVSVMLSNAGETVFPRIGLIATRSDTTIVGDNPYPPEFSFPRGSLREIAGEVRMATSVARGDRFQFFACVTGPTVDCSNGSRLEFSVTVQ